MVRGLRTRGFPGERYGPRGRAPQGVRGVRAELCASLSALATGYGNALARRGNGGPGRFRYGPDPVGPQDFLADFRKPMSW